MKNWDNTTLQADEYQRRAGLSGMACLLVRRLSPCLLLGNTTLLQKVRWRRFEYRLYPYNIFID